MCYEKQTYIATCLSVRSSRSQTQLMNYYRSCGKLNKPQDSTNLNILYTRYHFGPYLAGLLLSQNSHNAIVSALVQLKQKNNILVINIEHALHWQVYCLSPKMMLGF